jgi:glycerophosphoryl diester phosphodiesterase
MGHNGTRSGDRTTFTEARCGDRKVRLKWHELRHVANDPPFKRRNLRAGLAMGASLEVDIRALACGQFVCLHDPILDNETTGKGYVAQADAASVSHLQMRASHESPLMLDELVKIFRAESTHPSALLQLDLKGEVDTAAERAFAATLQGGAQGFILSAYDWDTVTRVGGGVSGLTLGYDPTEDVEFGDTDVLRIVREKAPEADWIYLRRDFVRASYERGDQLVARLRGSGHQVDCWTIDHGTPEDAADLVTAMMEGCDQVTTNTAAVWANTNLN